MLSLTMALAQVSALMAAAQSAVYDPVFYAKMVDCAAYNLTVHTALGVDSGEGDGADTAEAHEHQTYYYSLTQAAAAYAKKKPSYVNMEVLSRHYEMVRSLDDPAESDRMFNQYYRLCKRLGVAANNMAKGGKP